MTLDGMAISSDMVSLLGPSAASIDATGTGGFILKSSSEFCDFSPRVLLETIDEGREVRLGDLNI